MRFLDQQPFFQQSALQINFPLHQQQFDTQSRHLEEEQQHLQDNHSLAQGYIDESGNLCIIDYPDAVDEVGAASSETAAAVHKQFSRHSTREKTRSSQKRRKKRKAKQQSQQSAKKELG